MMVDRLYKILLVDDEEDILNFLSYNLKKEGYEIFTASNGKDAIDVALEQIPDMIILDVLMPDLDGIETCSLLREYDALQNTIIVFLSARADDYTQIAGLDSGADVYFTKPIKPRLLISRIKALLRRRAFPANQILNGRLKIGNLEIDFEKFCVYQKGKEINFTKKEFKLLELLTSTPGKVFKREEIIEKIWGREIVNGERTIDVHIRKLRERLGDDSIKTVKGIGYKFDSQ